MTLLLYLCSRGGGDQSSVEIQRKWIPLVALDSGGPGQELSLSAALSLPVVAGPGGRPSHSLSIPPPRSSLHLSGGRLTGWSRATARTNWGC
ncbi:hypothetical protein EYF80_034059 [Liparis tanakae]|uniref:Uncharacterized protein n=1 Tax=Liparis tanakae TaxID=230148 RepID=A0A4Z2GSV6_9TELE|nr:hypothetical protein EYF80_034059 [Liparis tanakae]